MKKFNTGRVLTTKSVADRLNTDGLFSYFCAEALARYSEGDWGDTDVLDSLLNDEALYSQDGDRIVANYIYPKDQTLIQIITTFSNDTITIVSFAKEY